MKANNLTDNEEFVAKGIRGIRMNNSPPPFLSIRETRGELFIIFPTPKFSACGGLMKQVLERFMVLWGFVARRRRKILTFYAFAMQFY